MDECQNRLKENTDPINSVFNTINCVFEYMPLAALIDE